MKRRDLLIGIAISLAVVLESSLTDNRENTVATNILNYFPLPNQKGVGLSDTNNYFSPAPNTLDNNRIDGRIDQKHV